MEINRERLTVDNTEELVVFLIGARVNKWWLLPVSLPILASFPKMLEELKKDPESGLLGVQPLGFAGTIQYWKSLEHLNRYASAREKKHRPAWLSYMRKLFKNAAVGIWHETFLVRGGHYESIYTNMPPFGMGTFKPLLAATGERASASARLKRPEPEAID